MSIIASQLRPHRRRPGRSGRGPARAGFTLMELVMGMIVTGLVMSAIAALLSAVAMGWQQSGATQETSTHRVQAHARMHRLLKGVKQIGAVRGGSIHGTATPAAAMLWKGDANGDNKVQFSELALLIHEGGVGTSEGYLAYYDVAYPANWSAEQVSEADTPALPDNDIFKDSSINWFRTLDHVRSTLVMTNVVGATFTRTDGANITRPSLDYVLTIDKGDGPHVEYGTASVRPPAALPASERD